MTAQPIEKATSKYKKPRDQKVIRFQNLGPLHSDLSLREYRHANVRNPARNSGLHNKPQ